MDDITITDFVSCLDVLSLTQQASRRVSGTQHMLQDLYAAAFQDVYGTCPETFARMHSPGPGLASTVSANGKAALDAMDDGFVESIYSHYTHAANKAVSCGELHGAALHWVCSVLEHIDNLKDGRTRHQAYSCPCYACFMRAVGVNRIPAPSPA